MINLRRLANIFYCAFFILLCILYSGATSAETLNSAAKSKNNSLKNLRIVLIDNKKTTLDMVQNIANIYLFTGTDDESLNRFLLALYKTNLFMDVKINFVKKDKLLNITVKENKVVRNLEFKGAKNIGDPDLKKLVSNQKMKIFNYYEFEQIIKRLQNYYLDNGYLSVEIKKDIVDVDENLVDVTLNVKKNKKPKISDISFIGNKYFSKKELVDAMFFQELSPIKILSKKVSYTKNFEQLNKDFLKKFYFNHGFIDFKLLNSEVSFDSEQNRTKLKFEVEEGDRYIVKKINIDSDIPINEKIENIINKNSGKIYNQQKIDISEREVKSILSEKKYYSQITINKTKTGKDRLILEYIIRETKSNYIEKIVISGNTRTKDSVIRNQLTLHEGDIFDVSEIQTSYRRIYNLGFFEIVDLAYQQDKIGKIILTIKVVEKKTGEINLGGGYSSVNGLFAKFDYQQNNLMGSGDVLGVNLERGVSTVSLSSSYYKNNILNSLFGAGFGLFYDKSYNDILAFKTEEYGGKLMTTVPLYKDLSVGLLYSVKSSDIYDVKDTASDYIKNYQGKIITSSLFYKLSYDKRNVIKYPTSGYLLSFSQENAGLGGDKHFVSSVASANLYKTLFYMGGIEEDENSVVGKLKFNFGYLFSYDNYNLRIDDRYFLSDVRGFEMLSGISPRDKAGKAVGGDEYYNGALQIDFPVKVIKELNIKYHMFIDYGNLINKKSFLLNPALDINEQLGSNIDKIRISAGAGFTIETPFAPIEIDFAVPIIFDKSDVINHVYFSIGKTL